MLPVDLDLVTDAPTHDIPLRLITAVVSVGTDASERNALLALALKRARAPLRNALTEHSVGRDALYARYRNLR